MQYLTPEELKTSHKDEAHSILEKSKSQLNRFSFGIEIFKIYHSKIFGGQADVKILDLGTGSGTFARQLSDMDCSNICGVDIDDYRPSDVKSLYKEFKTADLGSDKLPWPDNSFNIATAWCVFPHLENPFHAGREVCRVLKPGGLLIFSVPHIASKPSISYFSKTKNFGHYSGNNNHIAIFTDPIIKKTILRDFEIIETEYAVRPKVFERGVKGKIRSVIYPLINKYFPKLGKALRYRWAYDAVYVARKK